MREDSYLIIALHRLVKDLDRETAAISSAHGLTLPQFAVLEALLSKGGLTVGEIKKAVLSSNGTIPVVIGNLQKMGLVERAQDPADHRRSIVSLTKEGRALIERIAPRKRADVQGKVRRLDKRREKKSSCDCWPRTGSRRAARTKNERHAHAQEFALDAGKLRLVAGSYQTHSGIPGKYSPLDFYDIHLEPHGKVELDVPGGNKSVMVFTQKGDAVVSGTPVAAKTAVKLGEGDTVTIEAGVTPIEILFMCSERLGEPIA